MIENHHAPDEANQEHSTTEQFEQKWLIAVLGFFDHVGKQHKSDYQKSGAEPFAHTLSLLLLHSQFVPLPQNVEWVRELSGKKCHGHVVAELVSSKFNRNSSSKLHVEGVEKYREHDTVVNQHKHIVVAFVYSEETVENKVGYREPKCKGFQRKHLSVWCVGVNQDAGKT